MVLLTRNDLAKRWKLSGRSIDRMRQIGILPWHDLTNGQSKKPIVRFKQDDIEAYEEQTRLKPLI